MCVPRSRQIQIYIYINVISPSQERKTNLFLGGLQCTACVLVFVTYVVQNGPLRIRRGVMAVTGMSYEEVLARPDYRYGIGLNLSP